jgi:hypothetical protein
MNIEYILYTTFFSTFTYIILYNTNAIAEYFKYIPFIRNFLKIKDYFDYLELTKDTNVLYINYISMFYNNFFIKLLTCPLCFGFWINLSIGLYYNNITNLFITYVLSVIAYGIFKKTYYGN